MYNNELYHWGVKGMKWGVRKKRAPSEDHVRTKTLKKKRLYELSNDELKDLNTRMQLEVQYKNLKKQNVSAGKKFIKDVAYDSAKGLATDYVKKYAKKGISATGKAIKNYTKMEEMSKMDFDFEDD